MKFLLWLIGILALFFAMIFGLSVFLSPDDLASCGAKPNENFAQNAERNSQNAEQNSVAKNCAKADAVIAISGGDTGARARKAVELYEGGWAEKIVFAGAAADPNSPSNAAQMREIALAGGVPDEAILLDESSRNTSENARNVAKILAQNGWTNVILVSENYHLRRAKILFAAAGENLDIRTTPAQVDRGWWLTPRGWKLEFSELGGIIGFYLNFQR